MEPLPAAPPHTTLPHIEPTPAAPPPEGGASRACGYCGAPLEARQDWCLHCGAAVTTRIMRPPTWRAPLVAMAGVFLTAVAALIVAFFALSDDDPSRTTGVVTPTPTVTPTTTPTKPTAVPIVPGTGGPAAEGTPPPGATPAPDESSTPAPAETEPDSWPQGQRAWTVVLLSDPSQAGADRRARTLAAQDIPTGVLRSNDFRDLPADRWIVFSGQYDDARAARVARGDLGVVGNDARLLEIVPR